MSGRWKVRSVFGEEHVVALSSDVSWADLQCTVDFAQGRMLLHDLSRDPTSQHEMVAIYEAVTADDRPFRTDVDNETILRRLESALHWGELVVLAGPPSEETVFKVPVERTPEELRPPARKNA